jgi:hypothetical protein
MVDRYAADMQDQRAFDAKRRRGDIFLAAIGVHLRAREHRHIVTTASYFGLAVASLVAGIAR